MRIEFDNGKCKVLELIKHETEKITGIEDISSLCRTRPNVMARWLYIKAAREFTDNSTLLIGSAIKRDHSTVVHALANMDFDFKYDKDLQTQYDELAIILTDKLNINAVRTLEDQIKLLQDRLHKLQLRKQKLINNELINSEQQDQKDLQVFWS